MSAQGLERAVLFVCLLSWAGWTIAEPCGKYEIESSVGSGFCTKLSQCHDAVKTASWAADIARIELTLEQRQNRAADVLRVDNPSSGFLDNMLVVLRASAMQCEAERKAGIKHMGTVWTKQYAERSAAAWEAIRLERAQ